MSGPAADSPPPVRSGHAAATPDSESRPRGIGAWLAALAPGAVALLLGTAARAFPARVEGLYGTGLYPKVAGVVQWLARRWDSLVPQAGLGVRRPSLAEVIVVIGVAILVRRAWRRLGEGGGALLRWLLRTAGKLYLVFLLLWGLNYSRLPLAHTLGLEVAPVAAAELARMADDLAADLSAELASGPAQEPGRSLRAEATEAWAERLRAEPRLGWSSRPVLRAPLASRALTASGISGIFGPFTQECHVAAGLLPEDRAFVACHEIAHSQGWAREDEANYLAWRVGSRSSSHGMRVGALLLGLIHVHRALARADPEAQRERVLALPEQIVELIDRRRTFWMGERVAVASQVATAVNDTYLRSQGQEGVASYGRMVDLMAAEWRTR